MKNNLLDINYTKKQTHQPYFVNVNEIHLNGTVLAPCTNNRKDLVLFLYLLLL